jgi:hypothetical protein
VISAFERRTSIGQEISKVLFSLTQRRRADHLLVEVPQVEQREYKGTGFARIGTRPDQADRGLPIWANSLEIPKEIRLLCRRSREGPSYIRPPTAPIIYGHPDHVQDTTGTLNITEIVGVPYQIRTVLPP